MTILIKLISEETIKPSCPTPINLRFLQTSLFDHINAQILAPLIFYYSNKNTLNNTTSINETLDRLKNSLPTTLDVFYPLAGRVKNANYIDCNDEGVPYVQVKVLQPLEDVVHKAEMSQLDKLLPPYGQEGHTRLMLAIQVNVFACGGLAIGVKMNHVISDAFSLLMFVNTWGSIANGMNSHTLQSPYFDIWKLFPAPLHYVMDHLNVHDIENLKLIVNRPVTKWFLFSEVTINSLRTKLVSYLNVFDKINKGASNHKKTSLPSLAMVLSAFIWCRIKIACHNIIPCEVSHPVNIRPNTSPLDEKSYYFGNMVVTAIARPSLVVNGDESITSKNNESLFYDFIKSSKFSIGKIIGNDGSFIRAIEQGKEDLSYVTEHFKKKKKGEIVSIGISNTQGLPVYEADFGWGKPVWVTSASQLYKDAVILINAGPSSKDDIVAYVCLSCEDMAKLENDKEFNDVVAASAIKVPTVKSML